MIRWMALFCVLVALAGCGTSYVKPAAADKVGYVSFDATGNPDMGFAASLWLDTANIPGHDNFQRAAIIAAGNPFLHTDNPAEIPVPAGKEIKLKTIFTPAGVLGQYGCDNVKSLVADEGRRYKIVIDWKPQMTCNTSMTSAESAVAAPQ